MKKITLTITCFALVASVVAQNQYWSLFGNNNATNNSKLGTTNAVNLRLFTNNQERLRITSSGNVGIGTKSPFYKLQVEGNASISKGLYVGNNGIFGYNSSGAGVYGSGSNYGVFGTSSGDYGVYGTASSYGVYGTGNTYGVWGVSGYLGVYGNGGTYGVYGYSSSSSGYGLYGSSHIGVYGTGTYGLYGSATGSGSYGSVAYGGYIGSYGNGGTYGLYGQGGTYGCFGNGTSYGVYGSTTNGVGGYFYSSNYYGLRAGTGRSDKNWAGVFDGNVYSFGAFQTSDRNLKSNIQNVSDAMSIIQKLKPRSYEFRKDGKLASLNLPAGTHYGLIAQELEEVLPNLVKEVDNIIPNDVNNGKVAPKVVLPSGPNTGASPNLSTEKTQAEPVQTNEKMSIKSVNYIELIPIIIEAMQEQQATIDKQNVKIQQLTQLVSQLQNSSPEASVKLSGISLSQNEPNPVQLNGSTRIDYALPAGTATGELVLSNTAGQTLQQIKLNSAGFINLNTANLAAGTYYYTIYISGKASAVRKMIVAR